MDDENPSPQKINTETRDRSATPGTPEEAAALFFSAAGRSFAHPRRNRPHVRYGHPRTVAARAIRPPVQYGQRYGRPVRRDCLRGVAGEGAAIREAYIVMAYVVMAYIVMAYIVMAYMPSRP